MLRERHAREHVSALAGLFVRDVDKGKHVSGAETCTGQTRSARARRLARLAWLMWGAYIGLSAMVVFVPMVAGGPGDTQYRHLLLVLGLLPLASVGALIARRRPENRIGWLIGILAMIWSVSAVTRLYAAYALNSERLPGGVLAGWISTWLFLPALAGLANFGFLLFPDGHLPSRRWQPVAWLTGGMIGFMTVDQAVTTEYVGRGPVGPVLNPYRVEPVASIFETIAILENIAWAILLSVAGLAVFARCRRSRGVERQQCKWFLVLIPILTLAALLAGLPHPIGVLGLIMLVIGVGLGLPLVIAIAILRHGLYDIDVIINRTLVYSALTVTLGAIYAGGILALPHLLRPLTQGSDPAVALSTLAVAALFQPARRRIQAAVDRHFYRRKYDAARLLASFNALAREEVDRDRLTVALAGLVSDALQPTHVSMWLPAARGLDGPDALRSRAPGHPLDVGEGADRRTEGG